MALSTAKTRNELSLAKKYELVKVTEKNPKLGATKLCKTQVCSVLKNKYTIIELYESNASSVMQRSLKHSRTSQYASVNDLLVPNGSPPKYIS